MAFHITIKIFKKVQQNSFATNNFKKCNIMKTNRKLPLWKLWYTILNQIKLKNLRFQLYLVLFSTRTSFISNSIFFLLPRFAYGCMKFQPVSCLPVAFSIHLQPLVAQQLLMSNIFMMRSSALTGGRLYAFSPFLSRFDMFQKNCCKILKKLFLLMISTT